MANIVTQMAYNIDWLRIVVQYFPINGLQEANTLISQLTQPIWCNGFDYLHLVSRSYRKRKCVPYSRKIEFM